MARLGRLMTAMVTPFTAGDEVDYGKAAELAKHLIESGNDGLIITGTTGEGPTLSEDEKVELWRTAKRAVGPEHAIVAGTGHKTAMEMAEARGRPFANNIPEKEPLEGARGAEWQGIRLHSVRLPGLVAHHEVIFGAQGQVLTIRHDSTDRTSFMPGVLIAIREVMNLDRLVVGLDALLGLR